MPVGFCYVDDLVHFQIDLSAGVVLLALTILPTAAACGPKPTRAPANEPTVLSSSNSPSTTTGENARMKTEVPKRILDPILNEASKLANVPREQLVIVHAQAVVWNDGSLGCPEPGMEYAQALVNGYWVVINASGQTYDFRAGRDESSRLCPKARAPPPLPSDAA